jgi:hypothetical protein
MGMKTKRLPFVTCEGFLEPEMCAFLIDFFDQYSVKFARNTNANPRFAGRTIFFRDLHKSRSDQTREAMRLLNIIRLRAANLLKDEFHLAEIYPEHTEIVKWPKNTFQGPHRDITRPTTTYASILYLNHDFEGGQTIFPESERQVEPKQGMLLGFPGSTLLHGVNKVTKGCRYTAPCWFTDQAAYAEF